MVCIWFGGDFVLFILGYYYSFGGAVEVFGVGRVVRVGGRFVLVRVVFFGG